MQKLKMNFFHLLESLFTCFLKDKPLHNHWDYAGFTVPYYNIPSNNRELQQAIRSKAVIIYYNIPSNNRELQPVPAIQSSALDYNIPSNNRELQHFFRFYFYKPYYNIPSNNRELQRRCNTSLPLQIITYQVITGNYSINRTHWGLFKIITYQVITGNYSFWKFCKTSFRL